MASLEVRGSRFPDRSLADQKPPFQTMAEVERRVAPGTLDRAEVVKSAVTEGQRP